MIFVNKYGFVSVTNFVMICEKHSYLQLSIKLGMKFDSKSQYMCC